jgi:hypothetical protein
VGLRPVGWVSKGATTRPPRGMPRCTICGTRGIGSLQPEPAGPRTSGPKPTTPGANEAGIAYIMLREEALGGLGAEPPRPPRPLALAASTSRIQRAKHGQGGGGEEPGWSLAPAPASSRARPPGCGETAGRHRCHRELSLRRACRGGIRRTALGAGVSSFCPGAEAWDSRVRSVEGERAGTPGWLAR